MEEAVLGNGDVERPRPGVVLDLALLAVQAGLGQGFHIPSKDALDTPRCNKATGREPT